MKPIYLDYAATTPAAVEVIAAMQPYFGENFGNASSLHDLGFRARQAVETARSTIADFIGAAVDDIFFTSSGTEANNMAVQGCVFAAGRVPAHIITSAVEHSSVYSTCMFMESLGHEVTVVPVDHEGMVDPDAIETAINAGTVLITVQYANNEIGTIQPIARIGEIAEKHGIVFHTDAVQAFGKIPINAARQKITMLSASGHKLYGPKGSGHLYVNRRDAEARFLARGIRPVPDTLLQPLMYGGPQEAGLRPATENVPAIVGLGKAVELARDSMACSAERERQLRDYAIERLLSEIPGAGLNGHSFERRSPAAWRSRSAEQAMLSRGPPHCLAQPRIAGTFSLQAAAPRPHHPYCRGCGESIRHGPYAPRKEPRFRASQQLTYTNGLETLGP